MVSPGQRVSQGDELMRLDAASLEFSLLEAELSVQLQQIALEQLKAGPSEYDLAAARAAVARAQSQLDGLRQPSSEESVRTAQANLDIARSNLWLALNDRDRIRFEGLPRSLEIAEKQIDGAELSLAIAQQELTNALQGVPNEQIGVAQAAVYQAQAALTRLLEGPREVDLRIAERQIDLAQVAVDNARAALEDTRITAPFSGIVVSINFDIGEQVAAGLPALRLIDDSSYTVDVLADELDIARIEVGQLAFIDLDAFPGAEVTAHVERIAPDAVVFNSITSYEVRLRVDPTDVAIRDGMTATVDVVVSELTDVLLVPNWAIRFDRETGKAYVNVQRDDGAIEEIEVLIGTRGQVNSEVLSGLHEGDVVVTSLEREGLDVFGGARGD